MDVDTLTQQLKEREADYNIKSVAVKQLMEENETLTTRLEKIEHDRTEKIEVHVLMFQLTASYHHVIRVSA